MKRVYRGRPINERHWHKENRFLFRQNGGKKVYWYHLYNIFAER